VFVGENITKTYTDTYTVRAERRISESHGKWLTQLSQSFRVFTQKRITDHEKEWEQIPF
jgi:hypothetical protein